MTASRPAARGRSLTLLRHAKSSWKDASLADIDRPLNRRGRAAADEMALRIREHGGNGGAIVASTSRRTRETVARMLLQWPPRETQLRLAAEFYTFDRADFVRALAGLDDSIDDVMVVGHNPALQEAISWLTGQPLPHFPTAACARLQVSAARWRDLRAGCATLRWLLLPSTAKT